MAKEVFELEFEPSEKSLELVEANAGEVTLSWSVKVINATSLYIVTAFSDLLLVSQVSNALDRVTLQVKSPEVFVGLDGKPASTPSRIKSIQVPTMSQPEFV